MKLRPLWRRLDGREGFELHRLNARGTRSAEIGGSDDVSECDCGRSESIAKLSFH